ncbi:MAG: hypothetical protein ACRDE5_11785, partial [Ginsengibacter sp.]
IIPVFSSCKKEYSCEDCPEVKPAKQNVLFYTPGPCVNLKPITLIVDGTLYLTLDYYSMPDCSTAGVPSLALIPGIHSWQALCASRTIAGGIIDVTSASCQVELIK